MVIPASEDPLNFSETDKVRLESVAAYVETTTHWTSWFRSVLGLRYDHMHGEDTGTNTGQATGNLAQPKGSLIFRPAESTELYLSAGRGFHSDDLRGVHLIASDRRQRRAAHCPPDRRRGRYPTGDHPRRLPRLWRCTRWMRRSRNHLRPGCRWSTVPVPGVARRGFELNLTYQAHGGWNSTAAIPTTTPASRHPTTTAPGHVGEFLRTHHSLPAPSTSMSETWAPGAVDSNIAT